MAERSPIMEDGDPDAGFAGNDWAARKARIVKAAGALSPEQFFQVREEVANTERRKITQHMQNALFMAQNGDRAGAKRQLSAVGYYMSPGVRARISDGPQGSFIVQNYDEKTGDQLGGYAVTPDAIAEMIHAYSDPGDYSRFVFDKELEQQRISMDWEQHKANLALTKAQTGAQQASAEAALALAAQRNAQSLAAATKARTEQEAELEERIDETVDLALELGGGTPDQQSGSDNDDLPIGLDYSGRGAENAEQKPGQDWRESIFYESNPQGTATVANAAMRQYGAIIADALIRGGNTNKHANAAAIYGLLGDPNTNFAFFETGEDANRRVGVDVNGVKYELEEGDFAAIRNFAMKTRRDMYEQLGVIHNQHLISTGSTVGFNGISSGPSETFLKQYQTPERPQDPASSSPENQFVGIPPEQEVWAREQTAPQPSQGYIPDPAGRGMVPASGRESTSVGGLPNQDVYVPGQQPAIPELPPAPQDNRTRPPATTMQNANPGAPANEQIQRPRRMNTGDMASPQLPTQQIPGPSGASATVNTSDISPQALQAARVMREALQRLQANPNDTQARQAAQQANDLLSRMFQAMPEAHINTIRRIISGQSRQGGQWTNTPR